MKTRKIKNLSLILFASTSIINCSGSNSQTTNSSANANSNSNQSYIDTRMSEYVYLSDYHNNQIHEYSLDSSGHLNHIDNIPASCKGPWKLSVSPNKKFVHVTCTHPDYKRIEAFSIDQTNGRLAHTGTIGMIFSQTPEISLITGFGEDNKYFIFVAPRGYGWMPKYFVDTSIGNYQGDGDPTEYFYSSATDVALASDNRHMYVGYAPGSDNNISIREFWVKGGKGAADNGSGNVTLQDLGSIYSLSIYKNNLYATANKNNRMFLYHYPLIDGVSPDPEKFQSIEVGSAFAGQINGGRTIAITSDGKFAYVARQNDGIITKYDLDENGTPSTSSDFVTGYAHPGIIASNTNGSLLFATANTWDTIYPEVRVYSIENNGQLNLVSDFQDTWSGPAQVADMAVVDIVHDPLIAAPMPSSWNSIEQKPTFKLVFPATVNLDSVNASHIKLYKNNNPADSVELQVTNSGSTNNVVQPDQEYTVKPLSTLRSDTSYTLQVTGVTDGNGNGFRDLNQNFIVKYFDAPTPGTVPTLVSPSSEMLQNVSVAASFTISYGPDVDKDSVHVNGNVLIKEKNSSATVNCKYSWGDNGNLILTPETPLNQATSYIISSNDVQDSIGGTYVSLSQEFVTSNLSTSLVSPSSDMLQSVAVNSSFVLSYGANVDKSSVKINANVLITEQGNPAPAECNAAWDGNNLILTPKNSLKDSTHYILSSSEVKNTNGDSYSNFSQNFTTNLNEAILTSPSNDMLQSVPIDSSFSIDFGPNIDTATVEVNGNIVLLNTSLNPQRLIYVNYVWSGSTLILTPQTKLMNGTQYTLYSYDIYNIYGSKYNDLTITMKTQQ